ncbi:MAG: HD domain-containing protein [Desulfobacterales bacterium]|nr:MAG: HD domain-containing protein [Desulfobacterales bacterium]
MRNNLQDKKVVSAAGKGDLHPLESDRFRRQVEFIVEIDKLKHTLRQTILMDRSRQENAAEHSWHIALAVLILAEYAQEPNLDFLQVLKMLMVHDLVEIDAGDTYCYDRQGVMDQAQREKQAAERIFNLLPSDQAQTLRDLWEEFEARRTLESRFANALDRFLPFLHNYFTEGQSWREHGVKSSQVKARMQPVADGARFLGKYVAGLIDEAVAKGYLSE